jgi:hypothetical protein
MAPKETKKDRERRLKKAEELTTEALTDCPTDDDEPDDKLLAYDAEGGPIKPGTSADAATAAAATNAGTNVVVSTQISSDSSDDEGITTQGKGSVRASTGRSKRAASSTRSSRSRSKLKKSKKAKKARRRCRRESSPSLTDNDRRRGRGRSPSSLSGSSSSASSGDSNWEEFYHHATVVKVRELLKTAPPQAPRDVSKGCFSFEASREVLFVRKADKRKKDKWMRESRSRRSDWYADYKGSISRRGHSGNNRVLRRNFGACVQPLMAIEKVLTTVPMGGSARKDLVQARRVLADRLYLLQVKRETNPTVAAFVEAKRLKGDERDLSAAVDKYTKMKKSEKASISVGSGTWARGGPRNRAGYNTVRTPAPTSFPVYLPTPAAPSTSGY